MILESRAFPAERGFLFRSGVQDLERSHSAWQSSEASRPRLASLPNSRRNRCQSLHTINKTHGDRSRLDSGDRKGEGKVPLQTKLVHPRLSKSGRMTPGAEFSRDHQVLLYRRKTAHLHPRFDRQRHKVFEMSSESSRSVPTYR